MGVTEGFVFYSNCFILVDFGNVPFCCNRSSVFNGPITFKTSACEDPSVSVCKRFCKANL